MRAEANSKLHACMIVLTNVSVLMIETNKTKQWLTTPNLVISKSNFISNAYGGVYLVGKDLGHVQIQSSVVQDSLANGLTTGFSSVKNLNLFNCSFIGNQNGIVLSSFSGNVNIENTEVSNSTSDALFIASDGEKTVHLLNSSIIHTETHLIGRKHPLKTAHFYLTRALW